MSNLRVISDVHGCINNRKRLPQLPSYIELCREIEPNNYSVQLGDMGFDYSDIVDNLDPNFHRFIKGNHDLYEEDICDPPHALGHFGLTQLGTFQFFFVRGGFSIDVKARLMDQKLTGHKSWWKQEELNHSQGLDCLKLYEAVKPDVVLSHDCPNIVSNFIGSPDILQAFGWPRDMTTSTQELMMQMLEVHSPKLWIFAHYHVDKKLIYHGTTFLCIAERQFLDFDEQWNIIYENLSPGRSKIFA